MFILHAGKRQELVQSVQGKFTEERKYSYGKKGCINVFTGKDAVDEMMYFGLSHQDGLEICDKTGTECSARVNNLILGRLSQIQGYCSIENYDGERCNLSIDEVFTFFSDALIERLNKTQYTWDVLVFDELGFMYSQQVTPRAACYVDTTGSKRCKIFLFANKVKGDGWDKLFQFLGLAHELSHTLETLAQLNDSNYNFSDALIKHDLILTEKKEKLSPYMYHEWTVDVTGRALIQVNPHTFEGFCRAGFSEERYGSVVEYVDELLDLCKSN